MSSPHPKSAASGSLRSPLQALPANLHWVYLLFAVPLVIFLAFRTPAFQSPDEIAHFYRSYQVAHGGLFARGGGYVDSGIERLYACVFRLQYRTAAHMTSDEIACERSVRWSGTMSYQSFPNTAAYFPVNYIPQAIGVLAGQAFNLSILNTLILSRLLNGAASILLCILALSACGRGRVLMFALLLLPMTLSLFASASQDATLIALASLALSFISRQLDSSVPMTRATGIVVFSAILAIAIGRPPNAALALVFFIPGLLPSRSKTGERLAALTLISVTVAITLAWWIAVILASRGISHPYMAGGNVDPKMQVANLLHHPQILGALWGYFVSHISYYIAAVIGLLGWLDTPMPGPYYLAMILVLLAAMFAEFARGSVNPRRGAAIIFSAAFIGIVGVFFIEYLLFTPVGGTDLNGTQGRHLLPLLIAAAAGVPSISASEKSYKRVTALVVAAQLITVFVLPQVIMARYYGG